MCSVRTSAALSESDDDPRQWTVVVPVKPGGMAKSRLSEFPAQQRSRFASAFALDALDAMLASEAVSRLIVVGGTDGEGVLPMEYATSDERLHVTTDPGHGLTEAIDAGLALADPSEPVAIMVADLPALRAMEVTVALTAGAGHRFSLICDRVGTGSTMLMGRRRDDLHPHFGVRSRARHVAAGAVDLVDLDVPGLRCDVDTAVDLWDARRLGLGPHTHEVLSRP